MCEVRPTEMDALYVCAPIGATFGDGQNAIEGLNGFQVSTPKNFRPPSLERAKMHRINYNTCLTTN